MKYDESLWEKKREPRREGGGSNKNCCVFFHEWEVAVGLSHNNKIAVVVQYSSWNLNPAFFSAWTSSLYIEFEFHRVSNCWVRACIKLDFCLSISSFGLSNTSFSGFFELKFSRIWVLRVNARRLFEFRVACSSTTTQWDSWHRKDFQKNWVKGFYG